MLINTNTGSKTDIESEKAPKGLSEETNRFISAKKNEPNGMLPLQMEAFKRWPTMCEPTWARVNDPILYYQDYYYYSAPKRTSLKFARPGRSGNSAHVREAADSATRAGDSAGVERGDGTRPRVAVDAVSILFILAVFKEELKKAGVYLHADFGRRSVSIPNW